MKVRAMQSRKHMRRDCRTAEGWISKPYVHPRSQRAGILGRPVPMQQEAIEEALLEIHEEEAAQAPMGMECEDCYRTDVQVFQHGVRTRGFRPYFLCRECAEEQAYIERWADEVYVPRSCACCR